MTDFLDLSDMPPCDTLTVAFIDDIAVLDCGVDEVVILGSDVIGPPGPPGPQGPPGSPGAGVGSYVHDQSIAATVWPITHNLGFYPNVTVIETTGDEVDGVVVYASANQITITFSAAVAGTAYLS